MPPTSTRPTALQPDGYDGPAAWRGEDFSAHDDWIDVLSPRDNGELVQAMRATRARNLDLIDIDRTLFPLPELGPRLDTIRREVLRGRGFVLLRGLSLDGLDMDAIARIYWGIGCHLGKAVSQNGKGHVLGHVRDLGHDAADTNVRVYQTRERQYYHADSCDIVSLLCLKPAKQGGLSSIVSSVSLYNEMAKRRPDLAALLSEPLAVDRRGEVPAGRKPYYLVPVFNHHDAMISTYYVRRYIESAQRFPDAPRLTEAHRAAFDLFDALAEDESLHLNMAFQPGDMQFLHNHTVLHDRTAYEDWRESERKRHLLRLWLCPPDGRPLPPAYADRWGSIAIGNRGGIMEPGTILNAPLEAL